MSEVFKTSDISSITNYGDLTACEAAVSVGAGRLKITN